MLPHDYREDDGIGLQHDTLAEGVMSFDDATYKLSDINVQLDSLADDPTYWSDDELAELRSLQRSVQSLHKAKREDLEETRERLQEVRERTE